MEACSAHTRPPFLLLTPDFRIPQGYQGRSPCLVSCLLLDSSFMALDSWHRRPCGRNTSITAAEMQNRGSFSQNIYRGIALVCLLPRSRSRRLSRRTGSEYRGALASCPRSSAGSHASVPWPPARIESTTAVRDGNPSTLQCFWYPRGLQSWLHFACQETPSCRTSPTLLNAYSLPTTSPKRKRLLRNSERRSKPALYVRRRT